MLTQFDNRLGQITMYKLVLWSLRILAGIAFVLSFFGVLHISFWGLAISLSLLSATSYVANHALARIWNIPTNTESYAITLLILFFILPPVTTVAHGIAIVVAAVIAVASKFIVAVHGRHLFNPAAFGAVSIGFIGLSHPSWWVGSQALWLFVLVIGLVVVRKIRRFSLLFAFLITALAATAVVASQHHLDIAQNLRLAVTSAPLLFLGTIMLTEPASMPARHRQQIIFGALVGLLYGYPWSFGGMHIAPATALLIGNLYAFFVNPHQRLKLRLKEIQHVSDRVANYVFTPDRKLQFLPGQYMEWTLDMPRHDSRGNRRTFSIASSPTEQDVHMGVKFYEPSSRFKQELRMLKPGAVMYAGNIAGDFTLPRDRSQKLAFIAGGIGITPFRSMLKNIVDSKEQRDIVLIYAVSDPAELAYTDVFHEAESHGIRVIQLLTTDKPPKGWQGITGTLTADYIRKLIPDHADRTFYVSGPQLMVASVKTTVRTLGVKKIKTDYFTGY